MGFKLSDLNPIKAIEHGISHLNGLVGWEKPGDGPGLNINANFSTPITDEKTQQAINTTAYMENRGNDMFGNTTAYNENENQDQSWWDRNKDWIIPTATTIATTSAGLYYNNKLQKQQNQFNAEQAQINRDYQTQMANTAHQREYADLLATGLNPVNTATGGGGAATPGGGQASSAEPAYMDNGTMANTALSLAETMKVLNENKYISAEKKAQIGNTASDTVLKQTQAEETKANTEKIKADTEYIQKQYKLLSYEEQKQIYNLMVQYEKAQNQEERERLNKEFMKTKFGQFASKYVGGLLREVGQLLVPLIK